MEEGDAGAAWPFCCEPFSCAAVGGRPLCGGAACCFSCAAVVPAKGLVGEPPESRAPVVAGASSICGMMGGVY